MRKALLTLLTLTFFLPSCATLHEPPRGRALSSHAGADFTSVALWSPQDDIFYRSFSSTATGRRQVVDSSTQGGGGNVAFSSDGGKIAYGFGPSLYTSELR